MQTMNPDFSFMPAQRCQVDRRAQPRGDSDRRGERPDDAPEKEAMNLGVEGLAEALDLGFAGGLFGFLMKLPEMLPSGKMDPANVLKNSINPNDITSHSRVAKESQGIKHFQTSLISATLVKDREKMKDDRRTSAPSPRPFASPFTERRLTPRPNRM